MKKLLILALAVSLLCLPGLANNSNSAKTYDVIVIGAGGGGLGAAAKLARSGMKVLLIEQHSKVGGYMTSFEREPYTFEVSLHAMDGLNDPGGMNVAPFKELGIWGKIKPIKLDPMYHSVYPDFTIDVPADVNAYRDLLKKQFPAEATGLDRLFKTMTDIKTAMDILMPMKQDKKFKNMGVLIKKHKVFRPVRKYWNATLTGMLNEYIHDPKLFAVFTQLSGFAGAEPDNVSAMFFSMMWISYHFGGYYYFSGGSQAVSNALADVIRENGGEIMLDTLVTKIVIENGKAVAVQTKKGDEFKCRYVVSNANAPATFFKLIGKEYLPADYVKKIEGLKIGMSVVVVYLGVNHDYRDAFHGMHEIMINESYDQAENFKWFTEGNLEKISFAIADYSVLDPDFAPAGKNSICLTTFLPYDWKNGWYEAEDYKKYTALKTEVANALIKRSEKFLPGLSKNIEIMEVGSPRTMEHFTLNPRGTIFGWDNIPEQSMMKRLPQETPIPNLYLAGAWTFPGGGQSAVINSGLMAAQKILKKDRGHKKEEANAGYYTISLEEHNRQMGNLSELITQARLVPSFTEDHRINGLRIFVIAPGSIFEKIGLMNGDIIEKVNDTELNDPEKYMTLLEMLKTQKHFTVHIIRKNQKMILIYEIR